MSKPVYKELTMAMVVLKLPNVKRKTEKRPRTCRYCEGEIFQRWGQVNKPVKDVRVRNVKVYRYRCRRCQRTFRHYREGNTSADQTERLRAFAVALWTLGLSYRASSLILSGVQTMVSFMTIWRDVQAEAQKAREEINGKEYVFWDWTVLMYLAGRETTCVSGCGSGDRRVDHIWIYQ